MSPNTIVLAKLIGPILLLTGLGIALNKDLIKKMLEDFGKNYGLMFFVGIISMILGMIIVQAHTIWTSVPAIIITIFGWMATVKGALLVTCPQHMMKLTKNMKKFTDFYILIGIIYMGTSVPRKY